MKIQPYNWQIPAIEATIEGLSKYPYYLRADDTGTGKTFISLFVCKALRISPFVVAPKIVLTAWREAAEMIGVNLLDVTNIEKLKGKNHGALHRLPNSGTKKYPIANWKWNLPAGTLVVMDETHVCGGEDTQNARVLAALRPAKLPAILMSATIADSPTRLKSAGYLLGLHNYSDYRNWCRKHGCVLNPFARGYQLMFSQSRLVTEVALKKIHTELFPARGGRLRVEDLEDFPENMIIAEAYDLPNHKEVQAIYDELEEKLANADEDELPIVQLLRARQKVELFKSVLFTQLTVDALEEGKSVAVFVSFKETMNAIEEQLKKAGIQNLRIEGGQNQFVRDEIINAFQHNDTHVIICMVQAGGVGISLHDLRGRPRVSLISPPQSAKDLKQVLGRIHRAGSKSKAIQKIVFVAGTVEEGTCKSVRQKLNNLSLMIDGDLSTGAGF